MAGSARGTTAPPLRTKSGGLALVSEDRANSGAGGYLIGYASTFGNVDYYGDVIQPGAFAASLKAAPNVPVLWQHDTAELIGHTATLREDQRGLLFKAHVAPTRRGKDVLALAKSGALTGVSIGYSVDQERVRYETRDGKRVRVHGPGSIRLMEVSLVTFPANEQARLLGSSAKALREALEDAKVESALEAGEMVPVERLQQYLDRQLAQFRANAELALLEIDEALALIEREL